MYRGFNLLDFPFLENHYENGKQNYLKTKQDVNSVLQEFITPDGSINGSKLQEDWLPQIKCDIFISHSHKDEKKAIGLSNFLEKLGLSSFVDSCIWGNVDKLLKTIDNRYCFNPTTNTYNYDNRNSTTSHVHMMLTNALFRMIDNCESIFFLNSPNSIKVNDVISKTLSPWLYSEISMTQVVRKKKPDRDLIKSETRNFSIEKNLDESLSIEYDVNLSHLTQFHADDFIKWINYKKEYPSQHVLDLLYKLFPLPNNEQFIYG